MLTKDFTKYRPEAIYKLYVDYNVLLIHLYSLYGIAQANETGTSKIRTIKKKK